MKHTNNFHSSTHHSILRSKHVYRKKEKTTRLFRYFPTNASAATVLSRRIIYSYAAGYKRVYTPSDSGRIKVVSIFRTPKHYEYSNIHVTKILKKRKK